MAKPDKLPRWADVDPATNVVEPPETKKNVGWVKQEKPPARFFNWLFYKIYQWISWLSAQVGGDDLRSNNPLRWDGSQLSFSAAIQIIFREESSIRINQIPTGSSPISLADGEVLVVYPDKTSASPVDLTAGTYATLAPGQYAVVAESSLTAVNSEHELILFRRRDVSAGNDEYGVGYAALEIPFTNQMIFPDSRFYLGGKDFDGRKIFDGDKLEGYSDNGLTKTIEIDCAKGIIESNNAVPVGAILAYDDYGIVGFPPLSSSWAFLDGRTITDPGSPFNGTTLKDTSGRYLVGYGTDGGADIDTAPFSALTVGNAGHQIDLQHSHTIPGHSHTVNSHTHSLPSHSHSISSDGNHNHGGRTNRMSPTAGDEAGSPNTYRILDNSGWKSSTGADSHSIDVFGTATNSGHHDHIIDNSGSHSHGGFTNSGGSGTSGSASPGTSSVGLTSNNSLSTTQSIQPRSIQARWIIRIK
ncbi:MAG TPA: hypothetical protein DF383_05020 [Deltaproteobacteria bacterium]|nr:hypothetical protein [Deltaproteobacteria bacterium]